jgi:hypothetical protein
MFFSNHCKISQKENKKREDAILVLRLRLDPYTQAHTHEDEGSNG